MQHPDMHDVFQLYQRQMGLLTGSQRQKLYQAYDEGMTPFVIGCAILWVKQQERHKYRGYQKRLSFNYLWKIVEDWQAHGIRDKETFAAYWETEQGKMRSAGDGGKKVAGKKWRQVFGKDYLYQERKPAAKGFFTFLDD